MTSRRGGKGTGDERAIIATSARGGRWQFAGKDARVRCELSVNLPHLERFLTAVEGGADYRSAWEEYLAALRAHPLGAEAAVIGRVTADPAGIVQLRTAFGGTRIVDLLVGDPLPRIC